MKHLIALALLTGLIGTLSPSAQAYFQCRYDYLSDGEEISSMIQVEKLNGQESLVIRDPKTSEGNREGIVFAFAVTAKENSRIGRIIRAESEFEGHIMKVTVLIPKAFPGIGRLFWDSEADEEGDPLNDCRFEEKAAQGD